MRLNLLPELSGLIWLAEAMELLAGGGPLRDTDGRDCGTCDDIVFVRELSPSSDTSVTRDEIPPTDGGRGRPKACCVGGFVDSLFSELLDWNAIVVGRYWKRCDVLIIGFAEYYVAVETRVEYLAKAQEVVRSDNSKTQYQPESNQQGKERMWPRAEDI